MASRSCFTTARSTAPPDGHGFAADFALEQIRSLDAGARFDPRFAGTRVPTLAEVVDWAAAEEIGIFLEIKEAERPDLAVDRVVEILEARGMADRTIIIGFDHVAVKRAAERHPGITTQAITYARHADILGVLRACGAGSVSIELDMLHPDDAKALHDAGFPSGSVCRDLRPWRRIRRAGATSSPWSCNGSPKGSSTRYPAMTCRSWRDSSSVPGRQTADSGGSNVS
jgi:glycerophosphoryl diester phosphodiesterase